MNQIKTLELTNFQGNLILKKIDVRSHLEQQIQSQEIQDDGRRFDEVNSMTLSFYKTTRINGSYYVKNPVRSSTISTIENDDKYYFLWSILASVHSSKIIILIEYQVKDYFFDQSTYQNFDFSDRFNCSDFHINEKKNNLSIKSSEIV